MEAGEGGSACTLHARSAHHGAATVRAARISAVCANSRPAGAPSLSTAAVRAIVRR